MSAVTKVLIALAVLFVLAATLTVVRAQGMMMGFYGTGGSGGSGPVGCSVNLSTKYNDPCSSIFARGR